MNGIRALFPEDEPWVLIIVTKIVQIPPLNHTESQIPRAPGHVLDGRFDLCVS
jgi:hypothetical protein